MQIMNRKYDEQIHDLENLLSNQEKMSDSTQLRIKIEREINNLLNGSTQSEVFYKNLVERLTVFKDKHTELQLRHLTMRFCFIPGA